MGIRRFKLRICRLLAVGLTVAIICCQAPAWSTAGFAESESSQTPGGNLIGDNDAMPPHHGTAIYRYPGDRAVYVDRIDRYGFYEGVVIGTANRQFFLFDESKQTVEYFSDRQQLCATVRAKNLRSNHDWLLSGAGLALVIIPLWILGRFRLETLSPTHSIYKKCLFSILILMVSLGLIIGILQIPGTNPNYFSC